MISQKSHASFETIVSKKPYAFSRHLSAHRLELLHTNFIMRTKIITVLLAVLTALGGLNLFRSIRDRLLPRANAMESTEQIRIKVNGFENESIVETVIEKISITRTENASESDGAEVVIDETFKVRDGQTLYMDVAHSDVEIETGARGEARIRVSLSGVNMARARDVFDEMNFSVRQAGDEIRVVSDNRKNSWGGRNGNIEIEIHAFIPESFNLQIKTSHGDVELENISGDVHLNTTHGDISASNITGKEITLNSTHGDIEAEFLTGEWISLKTTHADIDVDVLAGKTVSVSTTHSDIAIGMLMGHSKISSTHGDIEVEIRDSARLDLRTTHGDILLVAPANLQAELDLEAQRVRLDRDFEFEGRVEEDEIRGALNGGGSIIKARTSHGSVTIRGK